MATDYFHGIRITQGSDVMFSAPAPGYTPIGIITTSDDADATKFVPGKAVLLRSYGQSVQAQVGTDGTLKTVLDLINSLGFFPPVVVVNLPINNDPALQAQAVVDALPLLATASAEHEVEPKIIGAPGLDSDISVVDAMSAVLESLEGFGYVALPAATADDAELAKADYADKRMMALWPDFTKSGAAVSATALALGMRSYIDATVGPHKSLSNVAIPGTAIDGISALVDWNTEDSVANSLNREHITTLIRRSGNFYFWGNRTCNDADSEWAFEPSVRMADVINGIIKANQFEDLDHPMSRTRIENQLSQINSDIGTAISREWLLPGAYAWIDPAENTRATLEDGGLWVSYEYSVPRPLEQLGMSSKITNRYLLRVLPEWASEE